MRKLLFLSVFAVCPWHLLAQDEVPAQALHISAQAPDSIIDDEPVRTVVVQETLRFGYLSYDQIIKNMNEYEEAQKTVDALRAAYVKELNRSEEVFSKQFAEYVEGQKSFPENILLKRQKELQQTMEQSLQFKKEAKALLDEKEESVWDELKSKVDRAVFEVGMSRRLAFVINTDKTAYPFVNPGIGENITEAVLAKLKEQ